MITIFNGDPFGDEAERRKEVNGGTVKDGTSFKKPLRDPWESVPGLPETKVFVPHKEKK